MRDSSLWLRLVCIVATAISAEPPRAFAAGPSKAQVDAAIDRAAAYLRKNSPKRQSFQGLASLALFKAGDAPNSAGVRAGIDYVLSLIKDGKYNVSHSHHMIYEAGVNITLLADVDSDKYRNEIRAIAEVIIEDQNSLGYWDYRTTTKGDTSVSQYGMLGLWAAERAGVEIPLQVYEKAARWHQAAQQGGFAYAPGTAEGSERGVPSLSMTAAGVSSLLIARMYLTPNAPAGIWEQGPSRSTSSAPQDKGPAGPKFGVLEKVDLDADADKKRTTSGNAPSLDGNIRTGLGWLAANFRDRTSNPHRIYYYYTLERLAALANIKMIGTHDWYAECAAACLATQNQDGSFDTYSGKEVGTALAIMFLTKSSAKTLGRAEPDPVGAGLMAGGRGLPTGNLSEIQVKDGEIVKKDVTGPLDELLTQLGGNTQEVPVQAVQEAIIKKVTIGDRNELIGQTDKLLELAEHPEPDIRRTAIWALGRGGELKSLPVVMQALQDPNIDIVIEARNALCWISRKPLGFGLPETPLEGVDEDAPQAERDAAIEKWRSQVVEQWTDWYLTVRPYDERDDLLEINAKRDEKR